jgi:hypothetical protein
MRPEDMAKGKKYEVTHMIKGVQRFPRKSVMVFLGIDPHLGDTEYKFSARPKAGTQGLARRHIIEVKEVHPNTPLYLNARA